MRKQILSILSLVFAAASVNAQVATTYRGAFAPAPTPMWTNNWINWDPNSTFYPATNVTVSGSIVGNVTWTKNNTYKLVGIVSVDSLSTLTIEAGTIIRGDDIASGSALVVRRGAQIIANGTECNPIVFTSGKAQGTRAPGDWGGVIILGRGLNNLGTQVSIEGIDPVAGVFHGGIVANDNSGSMKYCRIELSGFNYGTNNEINGLTMGSVGSGTTIDHIEVSYNQDDAFEWFGGGVNCSYLVAYRCQDDDWDTDNGFNGLIQFGLSVKDPAISDQSTSESFESDNDAAGTANLPKTSARFYNITQIGAFRCAGNAGPVQQPTATLFNRGGRLRRNTELKIFNSILMNNWRGLEIDAVTLTTGQMVFQNNIIAMDTTTVWGAPYTGVARIYSTTATDTYANALALTNSRLGTPCDILTNAWDFLNPDYRPNAAGSGGALAGCDLSPGFAINSPLFTANQSNDFLVNVTENNKGASNGVVTVRLIVPSGWTVSVPGIASLTTTPQAGTDGSNTVGAYTNSKWLFSRNASSTQVIATLVVGQSIAQNATTVLGYVATRKSGTSAGTNQNLSGSVSGGGDNNAANNSRTLAFGAN